MPPAVEPPRTSTSASDSAWFGRDHRAAAEPGDAAAAGAINSATGRGRHPAGELPATSAGRGDADGEQHQRADQQPLPEPGQQPAGDRRRDRGADRVGRGGQPRLQRARSPAPPAGTAPAPAASRCRRRRTAAPAPRRRRRSGCGTAPRSTSGCPRRRAGPRSQPTKPASTASAGHDEERQPQVVVGVELHGREQQAEDAER